MESGFDRVARVATSGIARCKLRKPEDGATTLGEGVMPSGETAEDERTTVIPPTVGFAAGRVGNASLDRRTDCPPLCASCSRRLPALGQRDADGVCLFPFCNLAEPVVLTWRADGRGGEPFGRIGGEDEWRWGLGSKGESEAGRLVFAILSPRQPTEAGSVPKI